MVLSYFSALLFPFEHSQILGTQPLVYINKFHSSTAFRQLLKVVKNNCRIRTAQNQHSCFIIGVAFFSPSVIHIKICILKYFSVCLFVSLSDHRKTLVSVYLVLDLFNRPSPSHTHKLSLFFCVCLCVCLTCVSVCLSNVYVCVFV